MAIMRETHWQYVELVKLARNQKEELKFNEQEAQSNNNDMGVLRNMLAT